MIVSDHFTRKEIAPGVQAALMRPGGAAVSNAAIIDLGDRTLIIDTLQTLAAAEDLLAAAREATGRGAALVVNSHWHGDHIGGNQVFSDAEIIATPRTVELIVADAAGKADYTSEIDGYIAWVREQLEAAQNEVQRDRFARALVTAETLLREAPRFRLTLPRPTVTDRVELVGSDRDAEVLTYGGGHTESDAFVHLPDEGIVIAGDLLWVDVHPRTQDGDPAKWADILDRISTLGPRTIVPGHGGIGGLEHLESMAGYLRDVTELVEAAAADPDSDPTERFGPPQGSGSWGETDRLWDGVRALAKQQAAGA